MNRVSKVSVKEVLRKHLDAEDIIWKIMCDLDWEEDKERESEVGMLYGDWKKRFDDDVSLVWAADTKGGFGKKGWSVYGNCDDCRIVKISTTAHSKTLHLWYDSWGDWRD